MRAMPKAQVSARRSRDMEALGVREVGAVAVGGGEAQLHQLSLPNGLAVDIEILEGDPRN